MEKNPIPRPPMRRGNPMATKAAKKRLRKRAEMREILARIDPLVQQERHLVECYLSTGSREQAARLAGFDPQDPSPWARPSVKEWLAERRAAIQQDPEIATADAVLRLLTTKAMTTMRDFVHRDEHGNPIADFSSTPDYKLAAIKELEYEPVEVHDDAGNVIGVRQVVSNIKLLSEQSHDALVKLAQRLGVLDRDRGATTEVRVTLKLGAARNAVPITIDATAEDVG